MIRSTVFGAALFASVMLASCDSKPSATVAATSGGTSKGAMGDMTPLSSEAISTSGSGTVTALDPTAGKITLAHGPISAAGWPAMTMAFAAKPEVLKAVTVGDKVDFDLTLKDGVGVVTSLRPAR